MADLSSLLQSLVDDGVVPGAVGLVARGDGVEVAAAGAMDLEGTAPMTPESIFRVASITKPVVAAAAMLLVEDGVLRLDDPISRWLPELASPSVVRRPDSPVDDVVPARRPITVEHLQTFTAGWGFPADFGLPAVQPLFTRLGQGPSSDGVPEPDEWVRILAGVPLLAQPGESWFYNTCSDVLGVLVARASGRSLPDFLADRIFEPLGMRDTGFHVPAASLDRLTTAYRPDGDTLVLADPPSGAITRPPAFPSGAGGLVSTAADWLAFGRMLLAGGEPLLSRESVRLMTTDHLTARQRAESTLFLEGQGWGFGGSVDVEELQPWNVLGRYGWVGGTGTSAHVVPSTGTVAILLTQRAMTGPASTPMLNAFWTYAADSART
jgi:CubicO group peptidase (beta-lactamase class C family)